MRIINCTYPQEEKITDKPITNQQTMNKLIRVKKKINILQWPNHHNYTITVLWRRKSDFLPFFCNAKSGNYKLAGNFHAPHQRPSCEANSPLNVPIQFVFVSYFFYWWILLRSASMFRYTHSRNGNAVTMIIIMMMIGKRLEGEVSLRRRTQFTCNWRGFYNTSSGLETTGSSPDRSIIIGRFGVGAKNWLRSGAQLRCCLMSSCIVALV